MRKILSILLALLLVSQAQAGTVTGAIQNAGSGGVANGTLSFSLTQSAVVSGTASVVTTPVNCYTDASGNVVGEPNPLVLPVLSSNMASGTLTAGTYFVKLAYQDASGTTAVSPEASLNLASAGTLIANAPAKQPAGVTAYQVFIGATSGSETLQGTVNVSPGSWGNFSRSTPLAAGSAMPASNTTQCKIAFNDTMQPSFVCYNVGLVSSSGSGIPGFPQFWYLSGGASGSVNISSGTPQSNVCIGSGVVYPQAILSQPPNNASQSISGPLDLGSYGLNAGPITATLVNSPLGFWDFLKQARDCRIDGMVCDGTVDDSSAINACIANAKTGGQNVIKFPSGKCLVRASSINATNFPGLQLSGGAQDGNVLFATLPTITQFICDTFAFSPVCLDGTGSGQLQIENISLLSQTSQSHPSTVGAVFGRNNFAGGGNGLYCFAEGIKLNHFSVMMDDMPAANGGLGAIGIYNVGAERFIYENTGTTANIGFFVGATNDLGVSSPYRTLQTGCPSSMTYGNFINTYTQVISSQTGIIASGTSHFVMSNHNCVGTSSASTGACLAFQGTSSNNWDMKVGSESFHGTTSFAGSIITLVDLDHMNIRFLPAGLTGGAVQGFFWFGANNVTLNQVNLTVSSKLNGAFNSQAISNNGTGITWNGGSLDINSTLSPLTATNVTFNGTLVHAEDHTFANVSANAGSKYQLWHSTGTAFVGTTVSMAALALINGSTATITPAALGGTRAISMNDPLNTAVLPLYIQASDNTVDLANVASGACTAERTVTVTGARFGDYCDGAAGTALEAGTFLTCKVTSSDNVKWQFCNLSGGAVDRASDNYTIRLVK